MDMISLQNLEMRHRCELVADLRRMAHTLERTPASEIDQSRKISVLVEARADAYGRTVADLQDKISEEK